MPAPPSQKELLALEQSQVQGTAFLEAAASFLSCDLRNLEQRHLPESNVNHTRKSLAPREEFVLKLLLRRLSKSDDVLNGDFWILLAHLVGTIPIRGLTHLLDERGFFQSLSATLERILAASADEVAATTQYATSSDEDSGRLTKKRRLTIQNTQGHESIGPVLNLVCKSIAALVQLATGDANVDGISFNAVRNVLSAEAEDAASVIGKLLQLIQKSLAHQMSESEWEHLARAIPTILSVWAYRRPDNVGSSGMSSDQYFMAQCLRPALRLLTELQDLQDAITTTARTAAVQALERLVALHSVLPLRSLFLAEKAQQWKKTNIITWDDFKDLHAVVGAMLVVPTSAGIIASPKDSSANVLQYYNIAVRAVPRATIRRIQQEQPWLDCLFCVCAYLGDPNFPRLEIDEADHLVVQNSIGLQYSKSVNANLNELLTLATAKAVRLSLPVLLYISTVVLEMNINEESWLALVKTVEQDVNFLIPNSGLRGTDRLLSKIFDAISKPKDATEIDTALVRDGLIRPLLKGFAQARDLKNFLSLWVRGLQDSVQQRASGDLEHGASHLSLVWEDELLFKDFEATAKTLTASTLTQSMVAELIPLLQEAAKRIGPTSDIVSHVAVTTSLLSARPEDFNAAVLEDIVTATASALSRRSDYQLQRWRLWRLLRQCLLVSENSAKINEQVQQLIEKQTFVSLSSVSNIESSQYSYTRDARLKEALECFHLTISRHSGSQMASKSSLEAEFMHLTALFSATKKPKHGKSPSYGETAGLELASSCVAIISQQPQVLQQYVSITARLTFTMIQRLPLSTDAQDDNTLASIVKALLLSEEISSNAELFNDCCTALANLIDAHGGLYPSARGILVSLPLQTLKKNAAQKLADVQVQRLHSNATTTSALDHVLPDLGLLEMLVTAFSVSVGKPKKWAEFIDLAEHVLIRMGPAAPKQHQIALVCLRKMFDVLWSRCPTDEMSNDMSTGLKGFQSRLHELERSADSLLGTVAEVKLDENLRGAGSLPGSDASFDVPMTTKDLEQIAMHINTRVSSLGPEKFSELAKLVDQNTLESSNFLLLSAIIFQTSAVEVAQDQSLVKSMSRLATLQFALKAPTATDLILALETGKIILDKHPSVVNQHIVDTILSSIAALTSPNTMQATSTIPTAIFNRLCTILSLILSRHRKRLGGRYHLLLPTLQGLLKCLFFAGTSSTTSSQTKSQVLFIRSLPSWLRSSKEPLGPKSAEHFTRLLTTICDPSVSAIRRKKSNELTDETKKAKSLAGQYMQYLIMDFCRCSLHGRISSSSKEKLMPGLYAVLDVMDREVMREMNGAMDANGRAVWKGLYQDWERFGRWDRR